MSRYYHAEHRDWARAPEEPPPERRETRQSRDTRRENRDPETVARDGNRAKSRVASRRARSRAPPPSVTAVYFSSLQSAMTIFFFVVPDEDPAREREQSVPCRAGQSIRSMGATTTGQVDRTHPPAQPATVYGYVMSC